MPYSLDNLTITRKYESGELYHIPAAVEFVSGTLKGSNFRLSGVSTNGAYAYGLLFGNGGHVLPAAIGTLSDGSIDSVGSAIVISQDATSVGSSLTLSNVLVSSLATGEGANSYVIQARGASPGTFSLNLVGSSVKASSGNAGGVTFNSGGSTNNLGFTVNLGQGSSVSAGGPNQDGMYLAGVGGIAINANGASSITGGRYGVSVNGSGDVSTPSGGSISLTDGATISGGVDAIHVSGVGANEKIALSNKAQLQAASGKIVSVSNAGVASLTAESTALQGAIQASSSGLLDVTLKNSASLQGDIGSDSQAFTTVTVGGDGKSSSITGSLSANNADLKAVVGNGGTLNGSIQFSAASTGEVLVDNATFNNPTGNAAITVDDSGVSSIVFRNGANVSSTNGRLVELAHNATADVLIDRATLIGDLRSDSTSSGALALSNGAHLTGIAEAFAVTMNPGTRLSMPESSTMKSLALNNGTVEFTPVVNNAFKTLTVNGDLTGTGGTVGLSTTLNAGGPLTNQFTDRLLIVGNVQTTGTTMLAISPLGVGGQTDTNHNGQLDASEGISVVQVQGASRANAFALAGGYVAAGPYQYTLAAFGPTATDASQRAGNLATQWDYRLGSKYLTPPDNPSNPNGPSSPGNPPPPIVAVVPQVPAYVSAQTALANYLYETTDTMHRRIGEIRHDAREHSGELAGIDPYARVVGGTGKYRSNLSFSERGYDFDSRYAGLQLGANRYISLRDGGSLRFGLGAILGSGNVDLNPQDGKSSAAFNDAGIALTGTYQHSSGWYVDGVLRGDRISVRFDTPSRGHVSDTQGWGWIASVETGLPIRLTNTVFLEPQVQVSWVGSVLDNLTDVDNVDVRFGRAAGVIGRAGMRLGADFGEQSHRATPYIQADVLTGNGSNSIVASGVKFDSGKYGNAWQVSGGLDAQLGKDTKLVVNVGYKRSFGSGGFSGVSATGSLHVAF